MRVGKDESIQVPREATAAKQAGGTESIGRKEECGQPILRAFYTSTPLSTQSDPRRSRTLPSAKPLLSDSSRQLFPPLPAVSSTINPPSIYSETVRSLVLPTTSHSQSSSPHLSCPCLINWPASIGLQQPWPPSILLLVFHH